MKALSPVEWKMYAECPEDEREECLLYEVGRECQEAKEHCATLRKDVTEKSFDAYREQLCGRFGFYMEPLAPFMLYPEWPEEAYLTIQRPERQQRLNILGNRRQLRLGTIRPMSISALTKKTATSWIVRIRANEHSIGWPALDIGPTVWEASFRIDWNKSDAEILETIREWLAKYRPPETVQRTHAKTGGGSHIRRLTIDLKRIGALRLLRLYPWNKMPEEAVLYLNQARWLEAQQKAQELVDSFPYTRLF